MTQNILILQCLFIIWLNTVIIILIIEEVYGNLKETNSLQIIMETLFILPQKILHHLNINQILLVILIQMEQTEKKEGVKIAALLK